MPKCKGQGRVVCDQPCLTLLGPADASTARLRFVERVLTSAIGEFCREFNRSRFTQMKGFSLTSDSATTHKAG